MNLIFFSHSYRKQDALPVSYFGRLMRSEDLIPNLDPPSESVNAAKLERHLNSSDGMVAILTYREGGVSPYILFEIALCVRARKPLLVFIEDVLPDDIIPSFVLQRRFSRHSFLRQVREHRHAIQIMKGYIGENPPPTYQPPLSRRSCLFVGIANLEDPATNFIQTYVEKRGYSVIDLYRLKPFMFQDVSIYESLASVDMALGCVDSRDQQPLYTLGAVQAAFIPCITFTLDESYRYHPTIPMEFQPRFIDVTSREIVEQNLDTEFDTYEEDFIELDNQEEVDTYASLLVDAVHLAGHYDETTRQTFIHEFVMGDKYTTGQAGAVGPRAHAHDMTFNQVWNQLEGSFDLLRLAEELSLLRQAMKQEATESNHDIAIGAVAAAERAANADDGPKVIEHLKSAGMWAFDIATKIGTSVAVAAIKSSLQL